MEWGRMGCRLSKIKSNCTHIVVFDFMSDKKMVCTGVDWDYE